MATFSRLSLKYTLLPGPPHLQDQGLIEGSVYREWTYKSFVVERVSSLSPLTRSSVDSTFLRCFVYLDGCLRDLLPSRGRDIDGSVFAAVPKGSCPSPPFPPLMTSHQVSIFFFFEGHPIMGPPLPLSSLLPFRKRRT